MKRFTRTTFLVLSLFLLAPQAALAYIGSVNPSPASKNVPLGNSVYLTVRWTVTWIDGGANLEEFSEPDKQLAKILKPFGFTKTPHIKASYSISRARSGSWVDMKLPRENAKQRQQVAGFTAPPTSIVTIASPQGRLYIPGPGTTLKYYNTTLSQSKTYVSGGTTTYYLTETILIPSSTIYTVRKQGYVRFAYERTFTDGLFSTGTGTIYLNITGGSSSGLNINRISLRFTNNASESVVKTGATVQAIATITFAGTGRIAGVWEIADPGSSTGQPIYRPLRLVRMTVAGGKVEIKSPKLPASIAGLYRIRLRLTDPFVGEANGVPTLRYFVYRKPGQINPPTNIEVRGPLSPASLQKHTVFQWSPTKGASIYRLEFYDKPTDRLANAGGDSSGKPLMPAQGAPRVAGMLVHADNSSPSVRLSPLVMRNLKSGHSYLWRVLAINKKGVVIGVSGFGEIRKH
jgi:hypothetical protein